MNFTLTPGNVDDREPLKSMDFQGAHLRNAFWGQRLHFQRPVRTTFYGRRTSGNQNKKEHEERSDAYARSNHASKTRSY